MIRSLDTLNRNLNILQKHIENTSSNISNIKTPGYKFQEIVQSTLNEERMINYQGTDNLNRLQNIGNFTFGNQIDGIYKNFTAGSLQDTGNPTDFAVNGDGFFTVRMDNGQIAYTKNGNFRLDEENRLVTQEGYEVLGINEAGERVGINIVNNNPSIDQNGYFVDTNVRFEINTFDNYDNLNNLGDTLFTGGGGNVLENPNVSQGYLEASNVDMAEEMIKLIEISRQFELNQKFIQASNETLGKAVNEIGRV